MGGDTRAENVPIGKMAVLPCGCLGRAERQDGPFVYFRILRWGSVLDKQTHGDLAPVERNEVVDARYHLDD